MECEEEFNQTLDVMNNKSHKRILSCMKGCCITNKVSFILLLFNYRKLWNKNMNNVEEKYIK